MKTQIIFSLLDLVFILISTFIYMKVAKATFTEGLLMSFVIKYLYDSNKQENDE